MSLSVDDVQGFTNDVYSFILCHTSKTMAQPLLLKALVPQLVEKKI